MSDINSPFLTEEDINKTVEAQEQNSKDVSMKNKEKQDDKQKTVENVDRTEKAEVSHTPESNEGTIEIKEESNLLKNIIIILIVLLILAILGLILYNFIASKQKENDALRKLPKEESSSASIDTNNFEMVGDDFKASSVIVD